MPKKKSGKVTGGQRMAQLGYKTIQIWVDPVEHEYLTSWAAASRRPLTRAMVSAALAAAEEELGRSVEDCRSAEKRPYKGVQDAPGRRKKNPE